MMEQCRHCLSHIKKTPALFSAGASFVDVTPGLLSAAAGLGLALSCLSLLSPHLDRGFFVIAALLELSENAFLLD